MKEKFSDNPLEDMKIENEFLKIKLKAQYGDAFIMGGNENLPPELENQFLKNIIAFEENHQKGEYISVYEKIGKPAYQPVTELSPPEISTALKELTGKMEKYGIVLNICDGPYGDEVIYKFITEELFDHEIEKESIFGGTSNFIYEEFHPNNKADIESRTHDFLRHWFTRNFDEYCPELDSHLMTADGRQFEKEIVLQKVQVFFDAFTTFKDDGYNIHEIKFELREDESGFGHSEGKLKYDAVMESGEIIHYEGPYKLYMSRQDKWWDIFYFIMPGFVW